jgi:Ca-activated chloride channel family protein
MNTLPSPYGSTDELLTAYALGETDPAQARFVEQELLTDPAHRRTVEEIRAFSTRLSGELKVGPRHGLDPIHRARIESALTSNPAPVRRRGLLSSRSFRVPSVLLALAACVVLVLLPSIRQEAEERRDAGKLDATFTTLPSSETKNMDIALDANEPPQAGLDASALEESDSLSPRNQGSITFSGPAPLPLPPTTQPALPAQAPINGAVRTEEPAVTTRGLGSGAGHGSTVVLRRMSEPNATSFSDRRRSSATARPQITPGTEFYLASAESPFTTPTVQPLSTFSLDVDTASYSNVRRMLEAGQLPPPDAVRVEEFVNYFTYRYRRPDGPHPFSIHVETAPAPWNQNHLLTRIALRGKEVAQRPAANLVFLIDVSGSMADTNKLPLVKSSLQTLVEQLRPDDRIAIAVYAGSSGLVLPSTPVAQRGEILGALERLEAGGSTNGGMGIHLAYDIARANFIQKGINRVILCTDGDFNVGITDRHALTELIREKAASGVFLNVYGFGMGNLQDATLESLSQNGNGVYGYIDSEAEARRVFVEKLQSTLVTIAKDVKVQVEFNPQTVASYRLVGYDNRLLAAEDFNNDRKDAGEVGAGHTITVFYEIIPASSAGTRPAIDPLKYQSSRTARPSLGSDVEWMTVKLRYKPPGSDESTKMEHPVPARSIAWERTDSDYRLAAAAASFALILKKSPHAPGLNAALVEDLIPRDLTTAEVRELRTLVRTARGLLER